MQFFNHIVLLENGVPNFDNIPILLFGMFVVPLIAGAIFAYRAKEKKVATFFFATFIAFILMNIILEILGKIM